MEKINFEKAIETLEKIVSELEDGGLSLDVALEKYEQGIKLSKQCNQKLNDAEKKVEVLMKKSDGEYQTKPFDDDVLSKEEKPKKQKKAKTKKNTVDDELLFS